MEQTIQTSIKEEEHLIQRLLDINVTLRQNKEPEREALLAEKRDIMHRLNGITGSLSKYAKVCNHEALVIQPETDIDAFIGYYSHYCPTCGCEWWHQEKRKKPM